MSSNNIENKSTKINESDRPDWFLYNDKIVSFRKDLGNAGPNTIQDIDALASAIYECKSRNLPVDSIVDSDGTTWLIEEYSTREVNEIVVGKKFEIHGPPLKFSVNTVNSRVEVEMRLVSISVPYWKNTLTVRGQLMLPMEGSHSEFYITGSFMNRESIT